MFNACRLGSIEIKTLTHNVSIPVDPNYGKLTGTRVHSPIVMQKEFDQTPPLLFVVHLAALPLLSAMIHADNGLVYLMIAIFFLFTWGMEPLSKK